MPLRLDQVRSIASTFRIKQLWFVIAGVVAALVIGIFLIEHLLNADTYRPRVESVLSDSLGRPVHLGHLEFSLWSGSLVAEAPSISDDPEFSSQPFLTAKAVRIGVEMAPLLFSRKLHITGLTIQEPRITLLRGQNGTWNYSSLGQEGKRKAPTADTQDLIPDLTVGKINIANGTVVVGTVPQTGTPVEYTDVNLNVRNFSFSKQFPIQLNAKLAAGGSLNIEGNAGPINQHDASLTPMTARIVLKQAGLVAAGLVQPGQGISGVADLDSTVVSNGRTAQASGTLHLAQLKVAQHGSPSPEPVDIRFTVEQDLQSLTGTLKNATVQVGKALIALTGTYVTRGNATTVNMRANGSDIPVDALEAFLPALGVQLPSGSRLRGGTLTANLNLSGPTTAIIISGPVRISNTQLAGFDLGQKLSAIKSLISAKTGSSTTIQTLSGDLRYGPNGTRTDNLLAVIPGVGSASGAGSISPAGALHYELVVKLSSGGLGGLATQAAGLIPGAFGSVLGQTTKNGIPLTITGTTSNPIFSPDLGRMVTGTALRRGSAQPNPLGNVLGGLIHH